MKKRKVLASAVCLALVGVGTASAAEVYELAPMTVTASRYEKEDVDVASSTQVISEEALQMTGQDNLQQALGFLDSVSYVGMGPNGSAVSSMTSKIVMRGVVDGTLVLVNGTPLNWRGKYNLEDIPADSIEKVEVIRGGGAVLYGSQATGGVINIITKKKLNNSVSVGLGNYGQQNYKVAAGLGDFSIAYNYGKWGDTGLISSTWPGSYKSGTTEMRHRFKGYEKHDLLASYAINDNMEFLYNHNESKNKYDYTFQRGKLESKLGGKTRYDRTYERDKDFIQLNLHDMSGWSGHLFYNRNTLKTNGTDYYSATGKKKDKGVTYPRDAYSKEKNLSYGYDVQKVWEEALQTFLVGTSFERNEYNDYAEDNRKRNIFSIFGSWDKKLSKKDNIVLSGRQTWTTGAAEDKNFHNFSGQFQYLHRLGEGESLYASVGQSFVLPMFSAMYNKANRPGGTLIGDPNLKPEKGMHYELGWKKEMEKHQYKAAFFVTRIKDNISYSKGTGANSDKSYAANEDFKNHGIELSMTEKATDSLTWHAGITYQDPKTKVNSEKIGAKTYWDREYGRFILNVGLSYEKNKWKASLQANYMADRVLSPSSKHSFDEKPYLLTALTVKYAPNSQNDIILTVNNILDRDDNIDHGSSHYGTVPTNFLLTYNYRF
ncbi:MAG: TonB-dependent receptor [Dialister sp.]|nr:TonB-dependent receptor [Dialister sp.]